VSFMASKTNATPRKEEVPNKEGPETPPDSPLLDLSGAAVEKLIRSAKKRGYVNLETVVINRLRTLFSNRGELLDVIENEGSNSR